LPDVHHEWKDSDLAAKWGRIIDVRGEVTKALEEARAAKRIGHSLDAAVTIYTNQEWLDALNPYINELRSVFIVSEASLFHGEKPAEAFESPEIEGLSILVEHAAAEKCERCWIHDHSVGNSSEHPTICTRCEDALQQM
jgi:isoleucyl-tRNA synthetase